LRYNSEFLLSLPQNPLFPGAAYNHSLFGLEILESISATFFRLRRKIGKLWPNLTLEALEITYILPFMNVISNKSTLKPYTNEKMTQNSGVKS